VKLLQIEYMNGWGEKGRHEMRDKRKESSKVVYYKRGTKEKNSQVTNGPRTSLGDSKGVGMVGEAYQMDYTDHGDLRKEVGDNFETGWFLHLESVAQFH
jgi:hypothetical protein